MTLFSGASDVIIDANIGVWSVVPEVAPRDPRALLREWRRVGVPIRAPGLWLAESTSAIRSMAFGGLISSERSRTALAALLDLGIEVVPLIPSLCPAALAWAERLHQRRAYDGFYLALAEQLGAEFWTADRGLAQSAREAGASWVHEIPSL